MDSSLTIAWFLAAGSLVMLLYLLFGNRKTRVDERVAELATDSGLGVPGLPGTAPTFEIANDPSDPAARAEASRNQLKERIVRAGLYKPEAIAAFMMVRLVLIAVPIGLALVASSAGWLPRTNALLIGTMAAIIGTIAPGFWLDYLARARQTKIRRSLPDVLDVMVVCLEGGLSLQAALSRVGRELGAAHPLLAHELGIVEREIELGRRTGDAMRQFANRFDLEELRSLASVISQTERYGASVVQALLVYSDTMRIKRRQRAEEMAQKASIKMVFPTLLCIFPGIFVVLLGPAAIQIYHTLIHGVLHKY
jgi:tight adherence protein C